MGQTNSKRVSHDPSRKGNIFRDDHLRQILDDIDEELFSKGYVETTRTGAFISKFTVWDAPAKNVKRAEITFDRTTSPPFINQCVAELYDESGATVISTTTTNIVRNVNKQITTVDTQTTRP
jgi:hypothetical protein